MRLTARKKRKILVLTALALALALGVYLFLINAVFVARDVRVEGNAAIDADAIIRAAQLPLGKPMRFVSEEKTREALESGGLVELVSLEKRFPDEIVLNVRERSRDAVTAYAGVVLTLVVRLFVPVNTLLMSSRPRGTFSFDDKGASAKSSTPLRALVIKEARLLVATPIYLMNACIGYVLVFVAAVAVAVGTATGIMSLDLLPPELAPFLGAIAPWGLAFFCSISSTTAASVSLEGSARWLMLTAPVPASTVLGAKAAVNLLVGVPFLVLSALLIAVSLPLDALSIVALFAVPLAACLLATFLGLALDARRPRYDWTTVYEPVKRGMPVFVVVFAGMGFAFVGMAAATLLGAPASLLIALVAGAGSLALYRATVKRGLSV